MRGQEEHEKPENLVQPEHLAVRPAETLEEEANSNNSLEGYAAMNGLNNTEMGRKAVELEEEKAKAHNEGKS